MLTGFDLAGSHSKRKVIMKKVAVCFVVGVAVLGAASSMVLAQETGQKARAYYTVKHRDPVLEEMRETSEAAQEAADEVTAEIRKTQKARDEREREEEKELTFEFEGVEVPESPDAFESPFHFPPTPQYRTGTCWCFATTSFFESEVARVTGRRIKLSEMHTVYYEYLEKARRLVEERGDSYFAEGSETNAVTRIWKKYGVVPRADYEGMLADDGRFDHSAMTDELEAYLAMVEKHDLWDEAYVLGGVRVILNQYMGEPPTEVRWEGRTLTPREFVAEVLELDLDDYVDVISTLRFPFYTRGEYEVPDNWWHSEDYYNFPLNVWYGIIRKAAERGYTLAIGGDVSEPGYQGFQDAAIVPEFDIPEPYINQDARELRFANHSSFDDHALHLVGQTRIGDHDWYLIKDSARSSRWGEYEGYYFYREDYVRLKMLSYTVHRDLIAELEKKVEETERRIAEEATG